jgi:hypothetical protein
LHVFDPDVDRNGLRIGVDGWVAQRGGGAGRTRSTPGRVGFVLGAEGARVPYYVQAVDDYRLVYGLRVAPGVAWRPWKIVVQGGPIARWDADPGEPLVAGHGVWASSVLRIGDQPRWRFGGTFEQAIPPLADEARTGGSLSASAIETFGRIEVGQRVRGEAATETGPKTRLPTVGGSDVLRGAPYGLLRGAWTVGADVEVRFGLGGGLWLAAFGDGASIEGAGSHAGGGFGLRFRSSPDPASSLRFDVGFTDVGWGLAATWGEVM